MCLKLKMEGNSEQIKENMERTATAFSEAVEASANMIASMIEQQGRADIAAAGKFGDEWTQGLHVTVDKTTDRMIITMRHDLPYAGIFQTGGEVKGDPMLWLPISGTDAVGVKASDYPDKLFSVQSKTGHPLLFSMADKVPKYFGIESVTIPKKFHLEEVARSVMENFRQVFDVNMKL